jgi:hypothetical protein
MSLVTAIRTSRLPSFGPVLGLLVALHASVPAADSYLSWSQGRPAESAVALEAAATTAAGWHDAGLAHAAAGATGPAVAALLRAQRADPTLVTTPQALRALGTPFPTTLHERLGPIALPGDGWWGVALAGLGGVALARRGRAAWATLGVLATVLAAPGLAASHLDRRRAWTTVVDPATAVDASGATVTELAAGTLLERTGALPWDGRSAVRLPDGRTAFVVSTALVP